MTEPKIEGCFRLVSEKWCGFAGHYKIKLESMLPAIIGAMILDSSSSDNSGTFPKIAHHVLIHGQDSFLPGVKCGFVPQDLIPCNCGNYQEPDEEARKLGAGRLHYFAMFCALKVPVNSDINFFCVN